MKKIKKYLIVGSVVAIFIIASFVLDGFFSIKSVQSASIDNASGWAWSETIGWISFNSTNCDSDGNGISDNINYPQCPVGQAVSSYGVNVDSSTGDFSGYAWSENIGWISFAPAGPYPAAPNYSANLDFTTNRVRGWAKAIAADGNGWDGWIKLGDDSGAWPAGGSQVYVQTLAGPDELRGWAWGSDVVGWISFNCADRGVCGSSNYKVIADINFPPSATCNDAETWNYCADSRNPTLSWTYSDPENVPVGTDPQSAYQIQIDNNSNFSSPEIDTGIVNSDSSTYQPSGATLQWNTTYYWHVRVKDSNNNWSVYSSNCSFTTPIHAYPDVDFSWLPSNPSALEPVQFTADETEFYNGANSWFWTFENAVPANSALQNPVATFSSPGNWDVKLEATDSDDFMCPVTQTIDVNYPLPEWKEIIPR